MQAGTSSSTAMPLVRLSQENLYRLVIPVPETYVSYIKIGDGVKVLVPALHKAFPGKVARFSFEVRDATRTMHTEVDVPNPTGELIPGLYAEASLTMNGKPNALAVPVQAVDRQGERTTVFVVDASNKLRQRPVTLGIEGETSNETEVLSGLNPGDQVVVSDRAGLKPGQEVHPQDVPPASYNGNS
jgi:RND family efflux transporter MFP subunit